MVPNSFILPISLALCKKISTIMKTFNRKVLEFLVNKIMRAVAFCDVIKINSSSCDIAHARDRATIFASQSLGVQCRQFVSIRIFLLVNTRLWPFNHHFIQT